MTSTQRVANVNAQEAGLPEDSRALRRLVLALRQERDQQQQQAEVERRRAEEQIHLVEEQRRKMAHLQTELLRLQVELERYKRWYYRNFLTLVGGQK